MLEFIISFLLLALSAFLARAWFRLLSKPTYMMEMTEFSRSALMIEKSYKLIMTAGLCLVCFTAAILIFVEQFATLPVAPF